jgi:drug/metabolite transporter (DMT)-like permease
MFTYHVIYFFALQLGDPIGVSLVHYLWPVIIVCLSARWSSGEQEPRTLIASVLLGFGGAAVACWSMQQPHATGDATSSVAHHNVLAVGAAYLLALLSAFAWAAYSVFGKRFSTISSHSVGAFSLPAGLACLAMHFATGQAPALTAQAWVVLVYMGLGPMGLAFYLWDFGMKKGNTSVTTALSYATPVLSTMFLALKTAQPLSATLWLGVAMVTVSVFLARVRRKRQQESKTEPGTVKDAAEPCGDGNAHFV